MGIKVTRTEMVPELIYDRFFLEDLRLVQASDSDNAATPRFTLTVQYRLFAVDRLGQRHFKPSVGVFHIDDYLFEAVRKAQLGDPDLLSAMEAIEVALTKIIADQTDLGEAQVI